MFSRRLNTISHPFGKGVFDGQKILKTAAFDITFCLSVGRSDLYYEVLGDSNCEN